MWASIETTKPNRNCVNLNTCTHNYVISNEAGTIYWLCCGGEQQTRGRPLPLVLLSNGGLARRALALPHTRSEHAHTICTLQNKVHTLYRHSHECLHASRQPKTGTFSPVSRYSTLSDSKRDAYPPPSDSMALRAAGDANIQPFDACITHTSVMEDSNLYRKICFGQCFFLKMCRYELWFRFKQEKANFFQQTMFRVLCFHIMHWNCSI